MKILLLGAPTTNGYKAIGRNRIVYGGGWVENLVDALKKRNEMELNVAYYDADARKIESGSYDAVRYYALPAWVKNLNRCNEKMIIDLKELATLVDPDVLHIIGSERPSGYELAKLIGMEKTVVSITGLVSVIEHHYLGGIPEHEFWIRTIGDVLRRGGPLAEKGRFKALGAIEQTLLKEAKYVMGRTTWDYACVMQINPVLQYTYCGEVINPVFYKERWSLNSCRKYRIFVSQATYPLKGLHVLLRAISNIMKKYPQCEVVIAGADILKNTSFMDSIKRTTYAKYIRGMIKQLGMPKEMIRYTGPLDAEQMKQQYLKSHIFVLPSAIENSPNSLGEAMILGMPCIASCVGGIQDMISHKNNGFLFPFDEPYMLAYYIDLLFSNDTLCETLSENARKAARQRFDVDDVVETTIKIYRRIDDNNK